MSVILCIETSTKTCSVALAKNGETIACVEEHDVQSHGTILTTFINDCLALCKMTVRNLDAVAVSIGPGSYTGLRIGLSTAKGLCASLAIPLIEISTLQSFAAGMIKERGDMDYYIPCFDARRNEIYFAVYDKKMNEIVLPNAHILTEDYFTDFISDKALIAGSGSDKILKFAYSKTLSFIKIFTISAKNMVFISYSLFKKCTFVSVTYSEPKYLKKYMGIKPKIMTE